MKIYEGMFLVDSRKVNRDWDAVEAQLTEMLRKTGATVHRMTRWVERKLSFPIKRHSRGTYVLAYFETPDQEGVIGEIYRQSQISDTIIRSLVVRIDAVPAETAPAPSAGEDGRRQPRRDGFGDAPRRPAAPAAEVHAAPAEGAAPAEKPAAAAQAAAPAEEPAAPVQSEAPVAQPPAEGGQQ